MFLSAHTGTTRTATRAVFMSIELNFIMEVPLTLF